MKFPRPFVAPPHLPHGLRQLNICYDANIRVKSTLQDITGSHADCHITTWHDSKLQSSISHVLALAPGDLELLTGEHIRFRNDSPSARVNFERPFVTPPKVIVFFNLIDLDNHYNWRLCTTATDIDEKGFILNIETWGDTIFHSAQAFWIAYPEDDEDIFNTSFNTGDVRPWDQPQQSQSRRITFGDVEF